MMEVRMFGGLCVTVDKRLMHGDLGASGRRLAMYLFAFPNRFHRRDRLCDLIWDEIDPERCRHALNTALWRMRRMLKIADPKSRTQVVSTAGEIALEAQDPLLIDVHRFESVVKRSLSVIADAPDLDDLRKAITAYHGPFLDGESDEWVLIERERLHCLYIRSLIERVTVSAISFGMRSTLSAAVMRSIPRSGACAGCSKLPILNHGLKSFRPLERSPLKPRTRCS